jgi:cyclopropane-fatty-acyl-phospholipid synthase
MNDDGVALIHAIGRSEGPSRTQPWLAKHIFPGGYIPALSEVLPAIERAGLIVADIEILRLHYAQTLAAWRGRFAASRAEVAEIRGEPFCRMWEFYLAASEVAFRYCGHMVFQLQLAKRIDAVPLTRAYIAKAEEALSRQAQAAA